VKTPEPLVGGTLATAAGLVFTGEANGHFSAYDASTGIVLWTYQAGANVGASPMTYTVNGRQFIAVATGSAPGPGGAGQPGIIRVFALAPN
jgi:glucose dehydrogenase